METFGLTPMLTDFYQFTIAKALYDQGRHEDHAVFDLFYRTQPFKGSFAVFAGLNDAISMLLNYKFTEDDLEYIKKSLPGDNTGFIDYLRHIDLHKLKVYAIKEGTIVFPREPLLRVEGPIAICQLLETPFLNAINFGTLMTTNAARFRLLVGNRNLMEFGLRRAQASNGAISATKYSYLGGFDSTSNVLAGKLFGIPIAGTVSHSFVTSYVSEEQLKVRELDGVDMLAAAQEYLTKYDIHTNKSELVAFVAQSISYPNGFLALVDTYDALKSGIPNFLATAYALHKAGHKALGVRHDSGDLAELSKQTRKMYIEFAERTGIDYARNFLITASNDINEEALIEFDKVGHEMNSYGIGTHLVTCQKQPALGGVFKLVEINGVARIKLCETPEKTILPGKKFLYRIYDKEHKEVCDLLMLEGEKPESGIAYECWPRSGEMKLEVGSYEELSYVCWDGEKAVLDTLQDAKKRCAEQLKTFRQDIVKIIDPKNYKVAVSPKLQALREKLQKEGHGI